jgi:Fic family protein
MFDRNKPNNALPRLPPEINLDLPALLKQSIQANRALGELKGLAHTLPNPAILINAIILQEARASSEIENIVTTQDALFKAFASPSENTDPQTKEVLRYREAVWCGYQTLKKKPVITTNLLIQLVQIIRQNTDGIRKIPGTTVSRTDGTVTYTPPDGESLIRNKLSELEKFIHANGGAIDPLIKMALIHYQFEAIHPFSDGNGRTGRILNVLYLIQQGFLDLPMLYLSGALIRKKNDYYRNLQNVTEKQQWIPWIEYMLSALTGTARSTNNKILRIQALFEDTLKRASRNLPSYMFSKELIEILFEHPYSKVQFLVDRGIAGRQRASVYLQELEKIGLLQRVKSGRENLFLNTGLMEVLGG